MTNYLPTLKVSTGKSLPILFLSGFLFLFGFTNEINAQVLTLHSAGATTICQGQSTTIAVSVETSTGPYTVVISNGTSNTTISNYNSTESADDPITVSPTTTTTYSLVSVTDPYNNSLTPIASQTVTITVNPLPTALNVTVNPTSPVCPGVNFTVSASATNGSTYEIWNQANTTKIGDLPYQTSINTATNYNIKAISSQSCAISQALNINVDNVKPTITCPSNQNLNTNAGSCNATLPDYTASATAHDNCTADGSIVKTQSPVSGTVLTGGHNSTQLVTITATDASGNSETCSFTVTVKDEEVPIVSGSAVTGNKNTDASQCYYTVSGTEFDPSTVTDNCGILKLTYKINGGAEVGTNASTSLAGIQLSKGANSIVWKAYDINGKTSTWSFTITVIDNQDPAITNCPVDRDLNMSVGLCTAAIPNYISLLGITATDNCGSGAVVLSQTPSAGTILSGGNGSTQLITVTATDASGKFSTCTFTITVKDVELPEITCPSNISQNIDAGTCGAVVTYTAPIGTDNCAGVSTVQTAGLASGVVYPVGVTTNTFETTDASNNKSTCSFTVTIIDNEFPVISCPDNIVAIATAGTCGAIATYTAPVGTDNCSGSITTQTAGLASGSVFPVGITTNTFEVSDASGNKTSCSFTVTVTDTEIPVIVNCPSNITQINDANLCGALVTWTEPTATDNCTSPLDITWTKSHSSGTVFPVGTTTVTYTAKDASNNSSAQCSFTVTITDNQKPVITGCPSDITKSSDAGVCTAIVSWTEPSATDNCTASGNLVWTKSHTPGTLFSAGTTAVTYTATDAVGNISNVCSFNVTVVDNQKPIISGCPANISKNADAGQCNAVVSWTEPTATDNCTASGSLTWTKSHLPGSTFPVGTTTVTYTAIDAVNNTSNPCTFDVVITDNIAPVAVCKPATLYLNATGIATLTVADVNDGSSDNCTAQGSLNITLSKTSFNCSNKGVNTVVMTVKDAAGKTSTCNATVTVVDNTAPTIVATINTVTSNVNMTNGLCYYTINGSEFNPNVTDNCTGSTMSYTVTGATSLSGTGSLAGKQLLKGANIITWTAIDASGNSAASSLTFTKTVVDNQAPTISSIGNQSRNTNAGCGYTIAGTEFDATYTDNCGSPIITYTINSNSPVSATTLAGVTLPLGINNIVWTISDGTNTRTSSFRVTVVDDDFPTITSISSISVEISTGCGAVVSWAEPTASDNCAVTVFGQINGFASGATFPVGTTLIRYWAKDAVGNTTYMSFNVVVTDITPPVLTCPSGSSLSTPFERNAANNVCFYTVVGTEFDPTTSDGCAVIAVNSFDGTNTLQGKQLPVGSHNITWTATDGSNNVSTCTIYVKVNDTQNPTYTQTTGSFTRSTDPGQCYFTIPGTDFDLRNVYDNCNTQTPTYEIKKNNIVVFTGSNTLAGKQLPKDATYPYSVVWTLSDVNGNTVSSTPFTISVSDAQPPIFVCYGNETREIPIGQCNYTVSGSEFDAKNITDNCDNTFTISYTLDGGTPVVGTTMAGTVLSGGTHSVVWTVADQSGNSTNCSFNVIIKDLVFPTISTISNQSKDAPSNLCYYKTVGSEFDPTVSDNCAGVVLINNQNNTSTLAGFEFPTGISDVVWTATDVSGNVSTMQFQVAVHDLNTPTFDIAATFNKNTSATTCYYTAVGTEFDPQNIDDNCPQTNYNVTNDFNLYSSLAYEKFPIGTTTVTWTVSDFTGNAITKTTDITVTDNVSPTISCPVSDYTRIGDLGKTYYTVGTDEFKPIASDNCSFTYINSYNNTSSLNGVQLPSGTNTITWTATDAANNVSTCQVVIHVVTELYPPITCVGDQSKSTNSSACTYTVSGTEFNATSTSGAATFTNDFNHSNTLANAEFPFGTTLVTWTATQTVNGTVYSNSCSFYVFVSDNENPVITPQADVTTNSNSGCYATGVDLGIPTTTDNCGVHTYSNNAPAYYSVGTTNVTWWVEDVHGNTSTADQKVTVIDNIAPTITCPGSSFCREAVASYTVQDNEFRPDVWENCSLASCINNFNSTSSLTGASLPVGTTVITWTATDAAGNSSTCDVTVVVSNSSNPPATCHGNQSRNTNLNVCTYTVQSTEFDITSSGTLTHNIQTSNASAVPYAPNANSLDGAILPRGTTNIIWTATSGGFTNSCCSFNVYVYDNQDPTITWPDNISAYAESGSCNATVTVGAPTATDNCDAPAQVTYSRTPSGNIFSSGTTNVYWTAWDSHGNQVNHTQTVTVTDTIFPVITCPSSTYYREYDNSGVTYYSIVGSEFTPPVSDNCNVTSYTNNLTGTGYLNGTHLAYGSHAIVWTAKDATNNTTTCTENIYIVDSYVPVLRCPNDAIKTTDAGACGYTIGSGVTLYDAIVVTEPVVGRTITHDLAGAPSNTTLAGALIPKGTTTITWTAKQTINGIEYTDNCSFVFTVTDNVAPVISPLPPTDTVMIDPGTCTKTMTLANPTATDNCTTQGNLVITNNAPATFVLGTTNVRWFITDESGNSTQYIQKVVVIDNEGPVIANCPAADITAQASGTSCQAVVSWQALIATDACSGVKSFTSTHSSGNLFNLGTTTVTYTATDNKNNVSTCSFNVVVTDVPPTISCITDKTRNTNSGTCEYKALGNEFDPITFADNCGVPAVSYSFVDAVTGLTVTGNNTLSGVSIPRGHGVGATGIIPITWTATDGNGNSTSCTFNLTIEDHEAPVVVVPGNQIRSTDLHQNYYTVTGGEFDDVTASDNCGIVAKLVNEYSLSTLNGLQMHLGENKVTWHAEDDKGNLNEAIFYAYVIDTEAPRLLTAPTSVTVNTAGSCGAAVSYIPPTFIDNVTSTEDLVVTISPDYAIPGYVFPVGITTISYSVVDSVGNSFVYTFNVTVVDDEYPTITCAAGSPNNEFHRNTDLDKAYYTTVGTEFNPSATVDNCSGTLTLSNNHNNASTLAGATFPVGTTEVIWTATDASNNATTCTIQVIVADNQLPEIAHCPNATAAENSEVGYCYYLVPGSEYDPYGFSDNQGLVKLTYSINGGTEVGTSLNTTLVGQQIPVGTTTVVWRLYDISGNISNTCSTVFTISDVEIPSIVTVGTQTRSTDAGLGDYTAKDPADILWNPTITDNCAVSSISYSIDGGASVGTDLSTSIIGEKFEVGTHTVVWTATDIHGNTNTGNYQVIIEDNENPTVVCNPVSIQLDATGNYTLSEANIAAIGLGSSDPNGIASMTVVPDVFDCADAGDISVILTVTDSSGNSSTCNATITVQDVTAPTAICKNKTVYLDVLGSATILPADINNNSSDACGIQSLSASKTVFNCDNVGTNSVILTVTDNNGNESTCTSTVTVVDDIYPVAVCKNITVYLDATGNKTISGSDIDNGSYDNCSSSLIKAATPNTFNCSNIGSNTVKLRVTDPAGNYNECNATVTVVDNIAPNAICQNITIQLDATGNATITANQIDNGSSDACGINSKTIDKSAFTCANIGSNPATNTVTLTLTDVNGNISSCTSLVTVEDKVNPTIICVADKSVNTDNNLCTYTHSGILWNATATDACNTIASLTYALTGVTTGTGTSLNGVVFNKGITTVTWTATDGSGNASTCSYTVTVNDNQAPTALCQNLTVQLDASGNASITANQIDNGSTDNCGIQSIEISQSTFTCLNRGPNTVTLTVTDLSNNTATCTSTVTVQDVILPVAVCKDITVQLASNGTATITGADVNNGSSDNCSIATMTVSPNTFDCTNIGTPVTVTLTVKDPSDNSATCTSTVTVVDNVAPTALCKNKTIQLDATGNASIVVADINNNSTDACGIFSLAASKTAFTCADLGQNTVTLTVTDNNTNVSSCDATVTVQDLIKPTFTFCPTNKTVNTDLNACTYTHNDNLWNATASDNCAVATLTYTLTGATSGTLSTINGVAFNKGVTTVTCLAIDASSNSETCTYTVTVSDIQNPTAICKSATVQLDLTGNIVVLPAVIDNSSTDNCGITLYEVSKAELSGYSSSVSYTCADYGNKTIYLKVTDAAGNSSTCSTTITISDINGPSIADLSERLVNTGSGVCTYTHSGTEWDVVDNCGSITSMVYTLSGATTGTGADMASLNGVVFNQGTTHVRWDATDNHSNTTITEFDVTVSDNQKPTITCPDNISQTVATSGATSATVAVINSPTYSDNCSVTKLTYSLSGATTSVAQASGINTLNSGTFNVGTTTVTYIAYDAANNSETCSYTITINVADGAILTSKASVTTSENLTYEDFTVTLGSAPTGNVVINVSSDDTGEGTVSVSQLSFNASNWNTPQTVRVTGVNDDVDDGDINYNINLAINKPSTDDLSGFENATAALVTAINTDNDVAGVTVSPTSITTTEAGGTATFTIVLNTEPTENVSFTVNSSDYTEGYITGPTDSTILFTPANWNTPKTITVKGKDEFIVDGNITYSVITSNATSADPNYSNMVAADVTVSNTDNDTPGFTVTPLSLNTTEAGGQATFTVVLTSKPATDVSDFDVVVTLTSNDLTEGTVSPASLTFTAANWNTPQTVTVTGVEDIEVDGNISYTIVTAVDQVLTTDANYDVLNPSDVTVTNADNDAAVLAIDNVTQLETNSGTTNFVFTVTHSGAEVVGGYSVSYYSQNVTAKAPSDYTAFGGSLSFTGTIGETKTITVAVNGDVMVEGNETFKAVLNSVSAGGKNVTINPTYKIGTGTVTNDDNAMLSINDATITEGNSGTQTLTFTTTLSMDVEDGLSVDYATANGTATTADADYVSKTGTLVFSGTAGETKTVVITINGDTKVENNETFAVNLSNIVPVSAPAGTVNFSDNSGTGTINNDDAATVSINSVTHNEGNSGTTSYDFTVTLSQASDAEVKVDYTTVNGTATVADADYSLNAATLTFAAGETSKTITVLVNGDNIVEPTENFTVVLSNLVNNGRSITLPAGTATGTGTITNDDAAAITINDVSITEGNSGTSVLTFNVTHSGGSLDVPFTVDYATAIGTATTADADFVAKTGTLNFSGTTGEIQTVDITINGDNKIELNETFTVNLSNLLASGRNITITDASGIGTITNDDAATVSIDNVTHNEGNSGTTSYDFTVTMSGVSDATVTVNYATANGTALTTDNDYTSKSGTLTFAAGETIKTVTVLVNGDNKIEQDETFTVALSALSVNSRNITLGTSTGTGTITNDDAATISINSVTHNEGNSGNTSYIFTVTLSNPSDAITTVDYTTVNGTATVADNDYTTNSGTLSFAAGNLTKTITVLVKGDTKVELNETFTVEISNLVNNGRNISLGTTTGTGTITNDDAAVISITGFSVNEAVGTANYTVALNYAVQDAFTIDFATSNNTALSGSDYTAVSSTLNFGGANALSQTVSVPITNDSYVEPTETLYGTISNKVDAANQSVTISGGGASAQATGTITD
ncbi:MAG: HYR domain-containing protein, partial [Bacteroidota bacterium]